MDVREGCADHVMRQLRSFLERDLSFGVCSQASLPSPTRLSRSVVESASRSPVPGCAEKGSEREIQMLDFRCSQ